jgi:hypothetical protein
MKELELRGDRIIMKEYTGTTREALAGITCGDPAHFIWVTFAEFRTVDDARKSFELLDGRV